jgi:hypothetical protein
MLGIRKEQDGIVRAGRLVEMRSLLSDDDNMDDLLSWN